MNTRRNGIAPYVVAWVRADRDRIVGVTAALAGVVLIVLSIMEA